MGRILAIDYGKKRTGLAVTDELQIIAGGLTTVETVTLIDYIFDYLKKEENWKKIIDTANEIVKLVNEVKKMKKK